ncbi:MAG: hypothetical protein GTO51_10670 [Candidatus Latescibacteria bacterium]|nr:hypothetical protein [Candidatus Latescibacterota bacterium]NIM66429.1 hypothetical protein [Candidatus Latescibacterota bacterium]NIO02909.1 hypothetical protein [Candidatus Latescibacterota bacterium]NIO30044.1 hypothetical protein [Candidatus Latescibacterota bacterium]NIO57659.1 hypothetical protein [Candidatus Latescibacterota bacterium]
MRGRILNRLASNVALSLTVIAALLIATEIIVRFVYHPENLGTVIQFDAKLGWLLKPGSYLHSVDRGRGLDYRIRINSLGLRERSISMQKPAGKKRVLILGDSIAFGTGVEIGERFSDLLGNHLGEGIEVVNGSICGWGNDQELLFYETFARRLNPDIVVLTLTLNNDILNNMLDHLYLETAPKPRFLLRSDSLILDEGHLVPPKLPLSLKIRRLFRKSRFLVYIKRRLDMRRYQQITDALTHIPTRGFEKKRLEEDCSYWSVYRKGYGQRFEQGWNVTEAILSRFISRCNEHGTKPIIFAFPLKIEVDDTWRSQLFDRANVDSMLFDFRKPYDRLSSFCAAKQTVFVYPLEDFREASRRVPLYFERDSHPNRNGHAQAAAALHAVLEDRL